MAIVIRGGTIVTMNPQREVVEGDLAVVGDRIAAVGAWAGEEGDKIIDASGMLVIPGLIQTHTHLCQTLFRGMGDDLELLDWLNQRIMPLEAAHDEESLYYSALLGCGELLRRNYIDSGYGHPETYRFHIQSGGRSGHPLPGRQVHDR